MSNGNNHTLSSADRMIAEYRPMDTLKSIRRLRSTQAFLRHANARVSMIFHDGPYITDFYSPRTLQPGPAKTLHSSEQAGFEHW